MIAKNWILGRIESHHQAMDRKWRQLPPFTVLPRSGESSVYYLTPAERSPSGGVKVIYRHVDELNAMGIPAAVVHDRHDFRCDWFENSTRVVSAKTLRLKRGDLLVLPECYGAGFGGLPPGVRVVVFNQGPHHTFDQIAMEPGRPGAPYSELEGLEGILTVSDDGAELLGMVFPQVRLSTARNVIDERVFYPSDKVPPYRISYVPSRRADELRQILHLLNARPEIHGGSWQLVALHGLSERGMADALRGSAIFLSLSDRDGFGLPPAEAMACGSYVVGYPGGGGREYFDSAYCSPAQSTTEVLAALVEAMQLSGEALRELGAKASASILGRYTAEGLRQDLRSFYGELR
ncbi:glycosyltransferase [Arthrobacter sp. 92]|uniref:glycosyltransferase n=1 Tax=Arthrobacter sp. 92 TaxID=3418175 RepID=UPI003D06A1A2